MVTMLVEQLHVVRRVLSAVTAPTPVVDVPWLLAGAQRLATSSTAPLLALPEVLDPTFTRKRSFQLPVLYWFSVNWKIAFGELA